ncbi:MAG: ABC transporter substrate-binding protein [Vicinamibacteria bacterium]|nr:ABC transporter substrate-binding protein [Vicinamibacteria bacterium]
MRRKAVMVTGSVLMVLALIAVAGYYQREASKVPQVPHIVRPEKLRLAVVTWVGFGPFYIAKDKGFFAQQGIDADLVRIDDFAARRAALASGDLHGSVETIDSLAIGAANGLPATLILIVDESHGGDGVVARKTIPDLAALRGQTIALPETTPSHYFLLYLLDRVGMKASDFKVQPMEAGDAGAAFVAGRVDAAVTWEPWLSQAKASPHGHVLATTADHPGAIADTFVVHPSLVKGKPEAVRGILRAWFKALQFLQTNRSDSLAIMSRDLGIPADDLEGMMQGVRFPSLDQNLAYFSGRASEPRFESLFGTAVRLWKASGAIPPQASVNVKAVYNPSFLQEIKSAQP